MTISSNTIVRNGMPFIGRVLRAVEPYVDEMLVTISEKSNDGTLEEILSMGSKKIRLLYENVGSPGELTGIRNTQAKLSRGDWILFLDDDDLWPEESLKSCIAELPKRDDVLCYAVNPYQMVDAEHYDVSWRNRWFSKWLRRDGLQYVKPWPRDLPADRDGKPLYWRKHSGVVRLPYKFSHLSNLKSDSFRNEAWASKFKEYVGDIEWVPPDFVLKLYGRGRLFMEEIVV